MNTKTIERITWKTWEPVEAKDFPCLVCHNEKMATHLVSINGMANMVMCEECSKLSVGELLATLGIKL